ncbi:unnamed protein product [Cylicostephanus goldi]|uniref:ATPase dynein-related AAA domain-containing protein n=1 Tax=Cylicostephanus goldi TaxID=71465 RepID=A0A3P7MST9_CYLGO|nr:unnamed protein product [Cylicostephanus goldi]
MVSKKKKLKAQKRKMADSCEDINLIEVPCHRRKVEDDDMAVANGKENNMDQKDVEALLPTRESLAHQLLVAVRAKHFVILEGPIGCGKTFLYSYISKELRLPLRTMQMGDQIDSKSLFGYYHCTEVAGQFIWKTSNFCQWLSEPCLILLEDIDSANADVISKIVQLASDRHVTIPTGEELTFHEDVRICATVSGKGKKNSVLNGVPVRLSLNELTDEELRRLIAKVCCFSSFGL